MPISILRRNLFEDIGRDFWHDIVRYRSRGLEFRDVVVYPTQAMALAKSFGVVRGGPDWPYFPFQIVLRHCRGPVPIRCDARPNATEGPAERAGAGLWCGPVSHHFGHMVADFGMRIAASARFDPDTPLVFSTWDRDGPGPPQFFWEILDHLGVPRGRVHLVARPTRFARLRALPQAERLVGGGPSRRHLALMDAIVGAPPERDLPAIYVSRSGLPHGRFAGEGYLDAALAAAGLRVVHPEGLSLAEQCALYRRARHLVFAEGSALHALQLLGHVEASVTVLVRRPSLRMAAASLAPRVRELRYLDALRGFVHGLRPNGEPHLPTGISVLDGARCLAGFAQAGIDLAAHWDGAAFARACEADVAEWVARRAAAPSHPGEGAVIARCLRALSVTA